MDWMLLIDFFKYLSPCICYKDFDSDDKIEKVLTIEELLISEGGEALIDEYWDQLRLRERHREISKKKIEKALRKQKKFVEEHKSDIEQFLKENPDIKPVYPKTE